jgi:hypothetical protein
MLAHRALRFCELDVDQELALAVILLSTSALVL